MGNGAEESGGLFALTCRTVYVVLTCNWATLTLSERMMMDRLGLSVFSWKRCCTQFSDDCVVTRLFVARALHFRFSTDDGYNPSSTQTRNNVERIANTQEAQALTSKSDCIPFMKASSTRTSSVDWYSRSSRLEASTDDVLPFIARDWFDVSEEVHIPYEKKERNSRRAASLLMRRSDFKLPRQSSWRPSHV